jgi:hypothetical protein
MVRRLRTFHCVSPRPGDLAGAVIIACSRVPASVVQTKIYVRRGRGATVARPRLSDHLNSGIDARLTLVSAPAGFGKTTPLAAWLASDGQRARLTAWLSLDQSENDPTSFWTYVIQTRNSDGGTGCGHRFAGPHRSCEDSDYGVSSARCSTSSMHFRRTWC